MQSYTSNLSEVDGSVVYHILCQKNLEPQVMKVEGSKRSLFFIIHKREI